MVGISLMSIDCSVAGKKAMRYIVELIDKKTLTGLQAGKVLIYDLERYKELLSIKIFYKFMFFR